jgi:hypothetical protein
MRAPPDLLKVIHDHRFKTPLIERTRLVLAQLPKEPAPTLERT